jgi:hypothetical protein
MPEREPPAGLHLAPRAAGDDGRLESQFAGVSCTVSGAGWYRFEPEWSLPERVRPNYILFVCVGGEADFVVDRQAYRLSAGGVLLTPPRVPHGARHNPLDPLCTYTVHLVARLFGGLDMPAFYGLPVALRPAPGCMAQIAAAAGRIVSELAAAEPGCTLAANGDGARLLALWPFNPMPGRRTLRATAAREERPPARPDRMPRRHFATHTPRRRGVPPLQNPANGAWPWDAG